MKGLRWPLKEFALNGSTYRDTDSGNFTDFYDWLRASDGALIGVRYWLRDDLLFLEEATRGLNYVNGDPRRNLEIYFSDRRDFSPELSADQEFLYDAVFQADDGSYAIVFGAESLTTHEMASLELTDVKWVVVQD